MAQYHCDFVFRWKSMWSFCSSGFKLCSYSFSLLQNFCYISTHNMISYCNNFSYKHPWMWISFTSCKFYMWYHYNVDATYLVKYTDLIHRQTHRKSKTKMKKDWKESRRIFFIWKFRNHTTKNKITHIHTYIYIYIYIYIWIPKRNCFGQHNCYALFFFCLVVVNNLWYILVPIFFFALPLFLK